MVRTANARAVVRIHFTGKKRAIIGKILAVKKSG